MKTNHTAIAFTLRFLIVLALTFTITSCGDDDEYLIDTTPIVGDTPPEAVDLGLPSGTKWATRNLNPTTQFVPWGDLSFRSPEFCTWKDYTFGKHDALTKYCSRAERGEDGYTDESVLGRKLTELEPEDDIARQMWGEGWRIPSKEQWQELIKHCYTTKGTNSIILTTWDNNKSIKLPLEGYGFGDNKEADHCYYWSRTLNEGHEENAYCFMYNTIPLPYIGEKNRACGMSIRPVKEE